MSEYKFFKIWLMGLIAVCITTLAVFGLIKVGGNMFDLSPASKDERYSQDDRLNCSYRNGTVVAENGEYKECKIPESKAKDSKDV